MTLIGHSVGKRSTKLARKLSSSTALVNSLIMMSIGALFFIFSKQIIMLFNSNPDVVRVGSLYLKIVPIEYIFAGIYSARLVSFQATGNAYPSMIINTLRGLVILLPLSYVLSRFTPLGIVGIWVSMVITTFTVFVIAEIWFRMRFEHHAKKGADRINKFN